MTEGVFGFHALNSMAKRILQKYFFPQAGNNVITSWALFVFGIRMTKSLRPTAVIDPFIPLHPDEQDVDNGNLHCIHVSFASVC